MARTERFEIRWDQGVLDQVDDWRVRQADAPTRAEAVRRLVQSGLASSAFSDGEKLILTMLCELFKHHKVMGKLDHQFITEAISTRHLWELQGKYPEIFSPQETLSDDASD